MRLTPALTPLCLFLAAPAAGTAAVKVPREARAVDTSRPDRWVGRATARSCTSRAVERAVARGGIIRFRCGPKPVRIAMQRTAKVVDTSRRVVLGGRGRVTLSGVGKRRILYQNTCDQRRTWTTSHCEDQGNPRAGFENDPGIFFLGRDQIATGSVVK